MLRLEPCRLAGGVLPPGDYSQSWGGWPVAPGVGVGVEFHDATHGGSGDCEIPGAGGWGRHPKLNVSGTEGAAVEDAGIVGRGYGRARALLDLHAVLEYLNPVLVLALWDDGVGVRLFERCASSPFSVIVCN